MRIKKFNEGVDDGFDIEYINQCFAELSDDFELEIKEVSKYLQIVIKLPKLNGKIAFNNEEMSDTDLRFGLKHSISDLIKNSEDLTKILKLIDMSVRRLLDEYPNYKLDIKDINDNYRTKILYQTKNDTETPKLFITITK